MSNPSPGAMMPPKTSAVYDQAYEKADLAAQAIGRPLDPDTLNKIALDAVDASVFGHDAKKNREGKRQQQGIGSPGHETSNHFAGIRKYEGEQKYQAALRKIWKDSPERAKLIGLEMPERLGS